MSACIPAARLCHLRKRPDFLEFGFNLHTDKNNGKFVRDVDTDSPASVAGLKMYDRIVEVNGINIANENHGQVVERVKSRENEVELLVVCSEADGYLRKNNRTVTSADKDVLRLPANEGNKGDLNGDKEDEVDPNPPRLCELHLRDSKEYGFVLHSDADKEGQYIGELDAQSPATDSGLRKGDKIIEVNNKSVQGKQHKEVISMIKEIEGVVKILVVDTQSERVYRRQSIAISNSLQNILLMPPATDDKKSADENDNENNEECTILPATTTELNNNNKVDSSSNKDQQQPAEEIYPRISRELSDLDAEASTAAIVSTPLEEPEEEQEEQAFSIPIVVKGVTTTVDLTEEQREKVLRENSHEVEEEKVEVEQKPKVEEEEKEEVKEEEPKEEKQEENVEEPKVEVVEEDVVVVVASTTSCSFEPAEVVAEEKEEEATTPTVVVVEAGSSDENSPCLDTPPTSIPVVTVDEVDSEDKEIQDVASAVAAKVTEEAVYALDRSHSTDDCTNGETGEPEPCPSMNSDPAGDEHKREEQEEVVLVEPVADVTEVVEKEEKVEKVVEEKEEEKVVVEEVVVVVPASEAQEPEPVTASEDSEPQPEEQTNEPKVQPAANQNGVAVDAPVDDSPIEPVKKTVSRYDSPTTPTSPGSFSMSRQSAPAAAHDAQPAIFSMSVAEARKKLVGAKQAKDVRGLQLTPAAKVEIMRKL